MGNIFSSSTIPRYGKHIFQFNHPKVCPYESYIPPKNYLKSTSEERIEQ
jgi:hypothetical protein